MPQCTLRALIFEKAALASEHEFHRWTTEKAGAAGLEIVALDEPLSEQSLCLCLHRISCGKKAIVPCECLVIVTGNEEWEYCKDHSIAALPYVPVGSNWEQSFFGAWMVAEGFDEVDFDFLNKCYQRAHNLPWTILTTERCIVRELSTDDMDALFSLYEQPGVTDYMEGLFPREQELDYQRAYIANMYRIHGYGMWLVTKRDTGEVIGRAGLEHREYENHPEDGCELELGYVIAPAHQRRGYAEEVCRAIISYARENLSYDRINCLIEQGNEASVCLARKLGFSYMESLCPDGKLMERYVLFVACA